MPWLMNKVCRVMALPFGSPAANAVEGTKGSQVPTMELDRYSVPEEVEGVFMGQKSTWESVARFLVYSLSASPPPPSATPDISNAWDALAMLQRRMAPFVKPSASGTWLWHCVTFTHFFVSLYYNRVCRERLTDCKAPVSQRLTKEADLRFLAGTLPLARDLLQARSEYERASIMDTIVKLSQLAAMHTPAATAAELSLGAPDPFAVDIQSMIFRATEVLGDPAQSDRHVTLLQFCSATLPALLLRWPASIPGVLPTVLWGIDPADPSKTMVSFTLLINLFTRVPLLDTNDWTSAHSDEWEAQRLAAAGWRWPLPRGCTIDGSAEDYSTSLLSSMLPGFALELMERLCDYVTRIPKPAEDRVGGAGHVETASIILMHSALSIVAAQCDRETYGQLLELLSTFLSSHLLPDQVKPMGLLVSAVTRACPEVAMPVLLPVLFRKLLPNYRAGGALATGLHEAGVSESEATWLLSALCSSVRHGGAALLPFRPQLEAVIRAALLDEREIVPKIGVKLLRRVLFSVTATYVANDHRPCGAKEWEELLAARCGEAKPQTLEPLRWIGPVPPWWTTSKPGVVWHLPSEEEVAWARELVVGTIRQTGRLLAPVPLDERPHFDLEGAAQEKAAWLDGLAEQLPQKKKVSHGVSLAIRLLTTVMRGTSELWPDERSEAQAREQLLPAVPPVAGNCGRVLFEWVADTLLALVKALGAHERHGAASASRLEPIEVPRLLTRGLKCVGELLGGLKDMHPTGLRLFPRELDLIAGMLLPQATALEILHIHAKWRDLPRVWWVSRLADLMEIRMDERLGGHTCEGRRRALIEASCLLAFRSGFEPVRHRGQDIAFSAARNHIGCWRFLMNDVLLPALADECQASLRCGSLTGEAASKEHQRLNWTLSGLAEMLGDGVEGLAKNAWRRGVDSAAELGLALCEAIYATTKVASGTTSPVRKDEGEGGSDQRCEVESSTSARLMGAVKHWLDQREVQCWVKTRKTWEGLGLEAEEEEEHEVSSSSSRPPVAVLKGRRALATVDKLISICERSDCHWRSQVMATTVAVAVLNALGPSGAPPSEEGSDLEAAKAVWRRWGKWLTRCMEPKAQHSLHLLGAHCLLLLVKRPAPLVSSELLELGLCEPAFVEKLIQVMPQLHHDRLINSGDRGAELMEPTRDSVAVVTGWGTFKHWPSVWIRRTSRAFSLRNAFFWQTYSRLLANSVSPELFTELLQRGSEFLSQQPVSEAEYHVAFTELTAGVLRALRKADARSVALRREAWLRWHPVIQVELSRASQDRLEDWCDGLRFIVAGGTKPLLREPLFPEGQEKTRQPQDMGFLVPLLNFVTGSDAANVASGELRCSLVPVRYDEDEAPAPVEGADAVQANLSRGSSFDTYKQLRLLIALLVEPSAVAVIEGQETFCSELVEALRPGLGHPYKQLQEEVARSLFLLVKAAKGSTTTGLGAVAQRVETWLAEEASRLLVVIRNDNATHQQEEDQAHRPRHVVECSGLCYLLMHASLARMTSRYFSRAITKCFECLLAATAHGHFELRALATHALGTVCSAHPVGPAAFGERTWEVLHVVQAFRDQLAGEALSDKEREKAFAIALRPLVMSNFVLLEAGPGTGLLKDLRTFSEAALGASKPEVRRAARIIVASFLALDRPNDLKSNVARYQAAAGPPPRGRGSAPDIGETHIAGIAGLACALLAAADCGVPPWAGKAIETLTPYGRQGMPEAAMKEVQGAIQAFLKLQQSSQISWKECQEKLAPSQLELLNDSKGKLSYFS